MATLNDSINNIESQSAADINFYDTLKQFNKEINQILNSNLKLQENLKITQEKRLEKLRAEASKKELEEKEKSLQQLAELEYENSLTNEQKLERLRLEFLNQELQEKKEIAQLVSKIEHENSLTNEQKLERSRLEALKKELQEKEKVIQQLNELEYENSLTKEQKLEKLRLEALNQELQEKKDIAQLTSKIEYENSLTNEQKLERSSLEFLKEELQEKENSIQHLNDLEYKLSLSNEDFLNKERLKNKSAELEDELKRRQDVAKKIADIESKRGKELTDKEKQALNKKSQKDKEKEDKKAAKEYKQELNIALREDAIDKIKNIFSNGAESLKDAGSAMGTLLKQGGLGAAKELGRVAGKLIGAFAKAGTESVNTAMTTLSGVYSKISTRLQDSEESFQDINDNMREQLAVSPFVKYTDMLSKIESLVDSGVAYNVEQRAFLASISDRIATTFNAFDSNLLQIIRIQQEDSTKQRLGMEARLTEFLNQNYQDTSYLNNTYDNITQILKSSIVQLGTDRGTEYEYTIQKWLGSLSSLGIDSDTLTGLASAINAAATGDVETLNNSQFNNLIITAANKSNISYADILSQGLNAESVNSLISSVVTYWSSIANESNQVVKNQYSKLFGLSMSDMTAIKNITSTDLKNIYNESLSYEQMNKELLEQINEISGRMHVSELIDNAMSNFMTGIGLNIASNPVSAVTWLVNDYIKENTGGINIPTIGALGNFLDIGTDLNSLIQLTMVGASTLGQMGKIISSLNNSGGLNLEAWGAEQYTRHGQGLNITPVTGVSTSTSQTTFIGNSSSSDIYNQTLNKAYENAEKNQITSTATDEAEKTKEQMENLDANVKAIYDLLAALSTGTALRVKVEDYGLTNSFGV